MNRGFKIAVTVVGTLLGLWFLLAGAQKFLSRAAFETMFSEFGLPMWSISVIGVLEITGALLVFVPRTAVYGAGLIVMVMIGAVASHLLTGVGSPVGAIVALSMAAFVLVNRLRGPGTPAAA